MDARQAACLAELQKIAEDRGGKCLATEYKNNYTPLPFECNKGHRWDSQPVHITKNHWCMACYQPIVTLETCQEYAASRGGQCLSTVYQKNTDPLAWQCAQGHQFKNRYKDRQRWCSKCAKN